MYRPKYMNDDLHENYLLACGHDKHGATEGEPLATFHYFPLSIRIFIVHFSWMHA